MITDLRFIDNRTDWKGMQSIVRIISTREIGDRTSGETRYYISSLNEEASHFNSYIRQHWEGETSCTGL